MRPACFASRRALATMAMVLTTLSATIHSANAQQQPGPARWLGQDTPIYLEIQRPHEIVQRLVEERLQSLLKQNKDYRNGVEGPQFRQFLEVVKVITESLDTTWPKAIEDLSGGGAFLAVEVQDGKPQVLVAIRPKDPKFLVKFHDKIIELARQDAENNGRPDPIKSREYRGETGYQFSPQESHAIVDDVLWISNSSDSLKMVVDRIVDSKEGKSEKSWKPLTDDPIWRQRRDTLANGANTWALARLDRLRELDPNRYKVADEVNPLAMLLFAPWVEAARNGQWVAASLNWSRDEIAAKLELDSGSKTLSKEKGAEKAKLLAAFLPRSEGASGVADPGKGRGALMTPSVPGSLASLTLSRDLHAIWQVREQLLPPDALQGLAGLDTFAGQFFGARDFDSGVLEKLGSDWRLIVAEQTLDPKSPVPDLKLPGFALVVGLKGGPLGDDFGTRLKVTFQSILGLANLGSAETKASPLMLGSEQFEGVELTTSRFLPPSVAADSAKTKNQPVHYRYNFSPTAAVLGDKFLISSSLPLARDLVKTLKSVGQPTEATMILNANGQGAAKALSQNKERLIAQNMLEQGNDRSTAAQQTDLLLEAIRFLGQGTFQVIDSAASSRFSLRFQLQPAGANQP